MNCELGNEGMKMCKMRMFDDVKSFRDSNFLGARFAFPGYQIQLQTLEQTMTTTHTSTLYYIYYIPGKRRDQII